NRPRGRAQREFELLDTGIFDDDRYFDVFVEYAKAGPDDVLMQVTAHNRGPEGAELHLLLRGPEGAELHLLPQLWFRDTWSWKPGATRPAIRVAAPGALAAERPGWANYYLHAE